jgi:uncharacterized protein YndB with AHSA1/START domain
MGTRASSGPTRVERRSELELVVTRTFDAPVRLVFDAWTKPELFKLWWAPRSIGVPLLSCEMDVRTGGGYRLAFGRDEASSMAFFGKYLDVSPPFRIVWTNDEGGEAGAVTTVTFEEHGGRTLLVLQELYPSKEALDASFVGMEDAMPEQFEQLDELLATLGANAS